VVVCVVIVAAFALVNLAAGLKYPPLLANVVTLAVLVGVMVHNLADEGRLR
jgi:hypothetical protein